MLFLVEGTLRASAYMGKTTRENVIRLVEASSSAEAETKFEMQFNKPDPYGTGIWVESVSAHAPIL